MSGRRRRRGDAEDRGRASGLPVNQLRRPVLLLGAPASPPALGARADLNLAAHRCSQGRDSGPWEAEDDSEHDTQRSCGLPPPRRSDEAVITTSVSARWPAPPAGHLSRGTGWSRPEPATLTGQLTPHRSRRVPEPQAPKLGRGDSPGPPRTPAAWPRSVLQAGLWPWPRPRAQAGPGPWHGSDGASRSAGAVGARARSGWREQGHLAAHGECLCRSTPALCSLVPPGNMSRTDDAPFSSLGHTPLCYGRATLSVPPFLSPAPATDVWALSVLC